MPSWGDARGSPRICCPFDAAFVRRQMMEGMKQGTQGAGGAARTLPEVVALLAVHNRLEYTKRCLAALRAAAVDCRLEVILVDDGSTDGTADWLRLNAPSVHVLQGDGNLWFGRALQMALDEAKRRFPGCDYIVTANNDTFFRPGAIDEMIGVSNGKGSIGASFWIEDRKMPGSSGFVWHWLTGPRDFVVTKEFERMRSEGRRDFCAVDLLATTAILMPARYCFQIKGIDTNHHPHNRADVCLTAQVRDAGSPLLVSSHFLADHIYGAASERYSIRNLTLRRFLNDSFLDRIKPGHLPCGLLSIWKIAPSRIRALPVIFRRVLIFARQLGCVVCLNLWRGFRPKGRRC